MIPTGGMVELVNVLRDISTSLDRIDDKLDGIDEVVKELKRIEGAILHGKPINPESDT